MRPKIRIGGPGTCWLFDTRVESATGSVASALRVSLLSVGSLGCCGLGGASFSRSGSAPGVPAPECSASTRNPSSAAALSST